MIKPRRSRPLRPVLFIALALSIPAFYLMLSNPDTSYRGTGSLLYGIAAILLAIDIVVHTKRLAQGPFPWQEPALNIMLFFGAVASAWPTRPPWSPAEWLLRLGFCSIVFIRLSMLLAKWVAPRNFLQIMAVAVGVLAIAGAGFYWLEPRVFTYADGLWLAFITAATVGYGDLVPSTPASRIFAVFIVLLGYAIFSVATATIAAFFVGEDEKRFEQELHSDIRSLREEIAALRVDLHHLMIVAKKDATDAMGED
jgi:voltage-gated potassium channel